MAKKTKYITLPEIAFDHEIDYSQLRQTIKRHKLTIHKARRASDNRVVNAITSGDYDKLLKLQPNLTANEATKSDVPAQTVAEQLGIGIKTLKNILTKMGMAYEFKVVDGRTRRTLTKKQVEAIKKARPKLIEVDV